jgi:hypothetical protein
MLKAAALVNQGDKLSRESAQKVADSFQGPNTAIKR